MKTILLSLFSILMVGLSGCRHIDNIVKFENDQLRQDTELATLKRQIELLKEDIQFSLDAQEWQTRVYLKPDNSGYTSLKTDLGVITVEIKNVVAYANGSKVTLEFGNPLNANINDLKGTIEWGGTTSQSRQVTFTQSLKAGAWTKAEVVLEGIKPTEFKFLRIKNVGHGGINLMRYSKSP